MSATLFEASKSMAIRLPRRLGGYIRYAKPLLMKSPIDGDELLQRERLAAVYLCRYLAANNRCRLPRASSGFGLANFDVMKPCIDDENICDGCVTSPLRH